jgi:sugar phosphate isomerase/epimerase
VKRKEDDKTRVLSIAVLFFWFILLETNAMAADKIVLQKYPGVKLGLLNVNFMKQWPLGLESAKKTIDYASAQGYWWIEVRDPLASLTLTQAKELAAYAEQKGIEIAYAMAAGVLDHNFWEVFSRGLASSAVFKGPRVVRTAGPGVEFATDPKKTHWTFGELQRAVKTANRAADFAKMFGLQYVVENGGEAFKGNGASTFGTSELFANANSNLGLQPDTGNFFVQRVWTKPEEAQAFIEKYADRVGYIHLKTSSKDHKPQPVAGDNELDHDIVFAIAAKAKMPYIGFELAQPDTLEQAYKNHKKSVEYLKRRFGG